MPLPFYGGGQLSVSQRVPPRLWRSALQRGYSKRVPRRRAPAWACRSSSACFSSASICWYVSNISHSFLILLGIYVPSPWLSLLPLDDCSLLRAPCCCCWRLREVALPAVLGRGWRLLRAESSPLSLLAVAPELDRHVGKFSPVRDDVPLRWVEAPVDLAVAERGVAAVLWICACWWRWWCRAPPPALVADLTARSRRDRSLACTLPWLCMNRSTSAWISWLTGCKGSPWPVSLLGRVRVRDAYGRGGWLRQCGQGSDTDS